MSHIVQLQTEVRSEPAVQAACKRSYTWDLRNEFLFNFPF